MASQKQIEACRRNWEKWRGVTPEGRERLREAARRNRPWLHSTGPKSGSGKARSRANAVRWALSCVKVEPFASQTLFMRALLRYAHAVAHATRWAEPGVETNPIPAPIVDDVKRTTARFSAAQGFELAKNEDPITAAFGLLSSVLHDPSVGKGQSLGVILAFVKANGIVQRGELSALRRAYATG